MPNVLLIGCDEELIKRLSSDRRWSVAVGVHTDRESNVDLSTPSPLHWRLIVDDCKDDKWAKPEVIVPDAARCEKFGVPVYKVTDSYLEQAARARGIRFASGESHWGIRSATWDTHFRELEFNPQDERAEQLAGFVHEFRTAFGPKGFVSSNRLSWRPTVIFADSYESPLIVSDDYLGFETLALADIPDKAGRLAALEYLVIRSAPKLWPDLYAGSFQPKRVVEWLAERGRLATEYTAKLEEIDGNIEAEERFFMPHYNLLYIGNDELKRLVDKALREVFGAEVTDLDEVGKGEKTTDLLIENENWRAFVEVSGSTNRNCSQGDLDDFDRHFEQLKADYPNVRLRVLVFNGRYGRSEEQRAEAPTFSAGISREGEKRGVGLIDTKKLLEAIEQFHIGNMTKEHFLKSLGTPGVFRGPWEVTSESAVG